MTTQNLDYYRQRANEELAAAQQAGDPAISQIHHEMAQRYREMLSSEVDQARENASMGAPMGGAIAEPGAVFG